MFGAHEQRMVDAFAAQFERDGDRGYLYRYADQGASVPVSVAERDTFIATYRRASRRSLIGLTIGAFVVMIVGAAMVAFFQQESGPWGWATFLCLLAGVLAVIFIVLLRDYRAPREALAGRATAGPVRSHEEAKANAVARQTWAQIVGVTVPMIAFFAAGAMTHDIMHGWYRLWWLFLAFALFCGGFAAIRKWRSTLA